MILIIKCNDDGDWNRIEGESAGERGSTIMLAHKGRTVGTGEVLGFKHSNKANQPMNRFANDIEARR